MSKKFKNLLETSAQLENVDEWEKGSSPMRSREDRGLLRACRFQREFDFPRELERIFKITDGILKYMIIKKNK